MHADRVGGCGLKYGAACAKRTGEQQGSAIPKDGAKCLHFFFYIEPLAQTTSNASKAVPSSKSEWTLSRSRADSASTTKK